MTVRTPLKLDGSNLREMTSAEVDAIKTEAIRQYGANPSVTLSVDPMEFFPGTPNGFDTIGDPPPSGNLQSMRDTRIDAGAPTTDPTNFDTAAETPDVVNYFNDWDRIDQAYDTSEASWTDSTFAYPLYYDGTDLREMSAADFADTFIYPAIDTLTTGSIGTDQAGTYHISSSTSVSGSTLVSTTQVFTDLRADAAGYSAAAIYPDGNWPVTPLYTLYFLHRINPAAEGSYELPVTYTKSGTDLQQTPKATLQNALATMMRYYAAEITGTKISYSINGAGNSRGTTITDTKLNSSTYLQRYVNTNDYRTQEVPSGTATTISTYNLKITQV
jgi:hypothetical protein